MDEAECLAPPVWNDTSPEPRDPRWPLDPSSRRCSASAAASWRTGKVRTGLHVPGYTSGRLAGSPLLVSLLVQKLHESRGARKPDPEREESFSPAPPLHPPRRGEKPPSPAASIARRRRGVVAGRGGGKAVIDLEKRRARARPRHIATLGMPVTLECGNPDYVWDVACSLSTPQCLFFHSDLHRIECFVCRAASDQVNLDSDQVPLKHSWKSHFNCSIS